MKTLIIYVSIYQTNTQKIAKVMAEVMNATLLEPEYVEVSTLRDYDLIGFGSGIRYFRFYKKLRKFVKELPTFEAKKAFIFATSGLKGIPSGEMETMLSSKGFKIVGTFSCQGFDTGFPWVLFGGLNKGRPNAADFYKAREFARSLKEKYETT